MNNDYDHFLWLRYGNNTIPDHGLRAPNEAARDMLVKIWPSTLGQKSVPRTEP